MTTIKPLTDIFGEITSRHFKITFPFLLFSLKMNSRLEAYELKITLVTEKNYPLKIYLLYLVNAAFITEGTSQNKINICYGF